MLGLSAITLACGPKVPANSLDSGNSKGFNESEAREPEPSISGVQVKAPNERLLTRVLLEAAPHGAFFDRGD